MVDAILTYLIVAAAAAFAMWKLVLPVRMRTVLRYALVGKSAPCEPQAQTEGCAGGCPGCGLAKAKPGV